MNLVLNIFFLLHHWSVHIKVHTGQMFI